MRRQHLLRAVTLACLGSITAAGVVRGDESRGGHRDHDDHARQCDSRRFGAVNDGKTDNAAAIQAAIDHCAQGGGVVPISGGGTFVTGPIQLRSHVVLRIDAPTVLKNTTDHSRYQPAFIGYPFRFANDPAVSGTGPALSGRPEAMISAIDAEDTGIVGDGTIDGSGADPAAAATSDNPGALSWWQLAANAKKAGTPYPAFPDIPTSNGLPRPWLVEFYNSRHLRIRGVLLTNSPMWNLGLRYDTDVVVDGLRVYNNANDPTGAPNTDGIDLVGSTGIRLVNLDIDTGDDNLALKSGLPGIDPAHPGVPTFAYYKPPYNLPKLPLSHVDIAHSTFKRGHGLSVGSETVNGVNHIRAQDITFLGTDNGFRIKTGRDRGNEIFGMKISRLTMTDVPTPISISEYYPTIPTATQGDLVQPQIPETQPRVHDIAISDVTATNPQTVRNVVTSGGLIIGVPESPVLNITLSRISITSANPSGIFMRLRNVTQLRCEAVSIAPLSTAAPASGHAFDNEGGLSSLTGCDVPPPSM
ncbi:glycosyl hydrolase family 28 protein [Bradyrhizobium sp. STM 3809]|uniref:glycoside hydrolase family 28 protein n=1 Tax=Bradyrhizobium sp. STM 3809 TaxID=551936 RepID=UPI000240ADB5|nr:glycosyl hydrolase family 28 protein [Bradyrhizobium sp. STM 3809]CCD99267.1 conserved exported hypothetical protein [Bradyrhizobium sp. STM 3809]